MKLLLEISSLNVRKNTYCIILVFIYYCVGLYKGKLPIFLFHFKKILSTIRCRKKKRPNEYTIHDILCKKRNLAELLLTWKKILIIFLTVTLIIPMKACLELIMLLPQLLLSYVQMI